MSRGVLLKKFVGTKSIPWKVIKLKSCNSVTKASKIANIYLLSTMYACYNLAKKLHTAILNLLLKFISSANTITDEVSFQKW